jgi:hypothetical protein
MRRTPPPLWFSICVAVALAWLCRYSLAGSADAALAGGHQPHVQQAFWPIVFAIVSAIWRGLEVAGRVTLAAVAYSVKLLWLFASKAANGVIAVGNALLKGLRVAWQFFELSYEKVIKPAFTKFWRWFDKFRKWLDDTFGPVLKYLRELRQHLLNFWKWWIRPWLDFIDVTRRLLHVLSSLGLGWAAALDRRLADLEARIERPFRLLLAKLNEVIHLVDRVITGNGLLQRVALLRSLERDYKYAWRVAMNPWQKPLDPEDQRRHDEGRTTKTVTDVATDTQEYMRDGTGPSAAVLDEMALIWKRYFEAG